ncbi:MAG TPA: 23S rRNA (guanosine(2251)-2'-O)-methyltransferase RlmB [Geminicoccaceae bacterium]|nr:23S rRNA (guanosine(2251)-2'-O)-methyltransferase RlmB [Geminicoccus sp.]HMU52829.1 23S rRNA (guanosine(2251)-2'-O)-methyltransferase RlmB [Geminicoccaceae bacterium]
MSHARTPTPPRHRRGPQRPAHGHAAGAWIWGRHAVEAALANPRRTCIRLLATPPALERLGERARRPELAVEAATAQAIERQVGADEVHQGLALEVGPLAPLPLDEAAARPGRALLLALDQISDPRNVGAILRSAAAFAVDAVIVPERRSAELGGAAARAAAGGLDMVPLVEVTNLAQALATLKRQGFWIVGLDGAGDRTLAGLPSFERVAVVLGSEGAGLRRLVAESCDALVRIEIAPGIDSLNVAVAAGIALHSLSARLAAGLPAA